MMVVPGGGTSALQSCLGFMGARKFNGQPNMSRIPQQPSSRTTPRTPLKPSATATARNGAVSPLRKAPATPTSGARPSLRTPTSLKPSGSASPQKPAIKRAKPVLVDETAPKPSPTSIREQIALKRAEAKKAAAKSTSTSFSDFGGLEDADPSVMNNQEEEILDLGRWSVKETIERARSSGAINLCNRDLPCLPSALFEIHLGIKPEPLESVPVEPPITTASSDDASTPRRRGVNHNAPSWYEAQDLEVLKARSNEIQEIQPEIFMFGSLKNVDLHNNQLTVLPNTFPDLTALTSLDLSHNNLISLPINFWALPNLNALNLSHNNLTSLPFFSPFGTNGSNPLARTKDPRGDWFSESITRATEPLPKLLTLDVSHNQLMASGIDHGRGHLPASMTNIDFSSNPLGNSTSLMQAVAGLTKLKELKCEHTDISDDSFPVGIWSNVDTTKPFPSLDILDLGETRVTRPAIEAAFISGTIDQTIEFDVTTDAPKEGTLRIIIGKRIIREAWEIEAERRAKRGSRHAALPSIHETPAHQQSGGTSRGLIREIQKEQWEIEAEQGLLTEGAKRRARVTAAAVPVTSLDLGTSRPSAPTKPKVVEKEQWEIEAEQGLLAAGGRRRARAAAVAASLSLSTSQAHPQSVSPPPSSTSSTFPSSSSLLSNPQYYTPTTQTLHLPPSTQLSKAQHTRSFSLATTIPKSGANKSDLSLAIPTPTLPLVSILAQPFAATLKVLILTNRRMDSSFNIPTDQDGPFLPQLEQLSLEGCNLGDTVPVSKSQDGVTSDHTSPRSSEPLLPLIARLFPSLRTLDLSYNAITSSALTKDALSSLLTSASEDDMSPTRVGLRHLVLRGNRITEMDGFRGVADMFKGNRQVPRWKLEELDMRDNEIAKLPAEVGLLPMDVFLVDGNLFRVPPRRVWEREGTKGLLSWLRGRIE